MDPNSPPSPHSTLNSSFPILAIAILGILTIAILLLSYYIFVTKCCLNLSRSDIILLRLSSISRSSVFRHQSTQPTSESRGLDSSTINSIPTVHFNKSTTSSTECSVCLTEFQNQEIVRLIPVCSHPFHLDCIDIWLQFNANCPLCRAEVGLLPPLQTHFTHTALTAATATIEQNSSDVVIDIGVHDKRPKQLISKMMSMGDECIDVRKKDERFAVNTFRRSFSMDSSNDRHLYVSVQEILRQNKNLLRDVKEGEGSSSNAAGNVSGRMKRLFSSFGRSSGNSSLVLL